MKDYVLSYNQTRDERYESDMNERAEAAITEAGAEVFGQAGGCLMDPDVLLAADQQFYFAAESLEIATKARDAVAEIVKHEVKLEADDGDD